MKSYTDPSFQDRLRRAAEAKQRSLGELRAKPPLDEKIAAERSAARAKREAAEAENRASRKRSEHAAREAKAEAKASADASSNARAVPPALSEAEKKLARDARYAARKSRK